MKKLFKYLILVLIVIFLSSCADNIDRDFRSKKGNLPSVMKITSIITPINYGDSTESVKYCYYEVKFEHPLIMGEVSGFTIIDTIGKYEVGDRYPKIK